MINKIKLTRNMLITVIACFCLAGVVLVLGGSVLINLAVTANYVQSFNAKQQEVQLKSALRTCRNLRAVDDAHVGNINLALLPGPYRKIGISLNRLGAAYHELYTESECPQILAGKYHFPK